MSSCLAPLGRSNTVPGPVAPTCLCCEQACLGTGRADEAESEESDAHERVAVQQQGRRQQQQSGRQDAGRAVGVLVRQHESEGAQLRESAVVLACAAHAFVCRARLLSGGDQRWLLPRNYCMA